MNSTDRQTLDVTAALETRASCLLGEINSSERPEIRLVWKSERLNSAVYEFFVRASRHSKSVIVKVPFVANKVDSTRITGSEDRPRMYSKAPTGEKGAWEFRTLQRIHSHFTDLGDQRFGTIQPLELLQPNNVLVLEKSAHQSMTKLLRSAHRWQLARGSILPQVFENVGAWLREFHCLPGDDWTRSRNSHRTDYVSAAQRFTASLAQQTGQSSFFRQAFNRLKTAAHVVLPDEIPLTTCHGDFAPRNVLVAESGAVTVFDTLARWRAPMFEDLAHFCLALRTAGTQASTLGWYYSKRQLNEWESSLLRGYYGDRPIPWRELRLFECLLALERWAAFEFRFREARGTRRLAKMVRATVWGRHFKKHVSQLVTEIDRE